MQDLQGADSPKVLRRLIEGLKSETTGHRLAALSFLPDILAVHLPRLCGVVGDQTQSTAFQDYLQALHDGVSVFSLASCHLVGALPYGLLLH